MLGNYTPCNDAKWVAHLLATKIFASHVCVWGIQNTSTDQDHVKRQWSNRNLQFSKFQRLLKFVLNNDYKVPPRFDDLNKE